MKLDERTINLIFDTERGVAPVQSREIQSGEPVGELPVPVRAGYTFDGWYRGEERIEAGTVLDSEEDVRLTAHWTKRQGIKRNSVLKRQKIAIVCLSAVIVLLVVALIFVNNLISITTFEDVYFENGVRMTQKYEVRRVDGVYSIYDKDGIRMGVNSDGYHIVHSGNQYSVNEETGECKLYALVDSYNEEIGELLGTNARVMMFAQIEQKDIYSIVVTNKNETFTVMRYANGQPYLVGTENRLKVLDDNAFAGLSVACGYPITNEKLKLDSVDAPRDENGNYDYSAYGLAPGQESVVYTITKRAYRDDGTTCADETVSYTVRVGDATLADSGYYAKLDGRDAVYIISPTVTPTLMQPSEKMVKPRVIYPMNVAKHLSVYNFILEGADVTASNAYRYLKGGSLDANTTHIVDFSFKDLLDREFTMNELHPYTTNAELMAGYFLDSDHIASALSLLHTMTLSNCVKNGITEDAIKEYLLGGEETGDTYRISFRYNILERNTLIKRFETESKAAFDTRCMEKAKALLLEYGAEESAIANLPLAELLKRLEAAGIYLEDGVLYDKVSHLHELYSVCAGMLKEMGITVETLAEDLFDVATLQKKVNDVVKLMNGTKSGIFYDTTTQALYVVNELLISQKTEDHKYYVAVTLYDMIVEVDAYYLSFLEWNSKNWYSQYFTWIEIPYLTDLEIVSSTGKHYTFALDNSESDQSENENSQKVKIFYDKDGVMTRLDYGNGIPYSYQDDMGNTVTKYIDGVTNFREFYQIFEYISFVGQIDATELNKMAQNTDANGDPMTPEKYRALDDSACDLIIYYRAVDLRGNSIGKVIRFYRYSDLHAYVTIDVVDVFDENGNPTTDWRSQSNSEDAHGMFYVDALYMQKLINDAGRVINQERVDVTSKS